MIQPRNGVNCALKVLHLFFLTIFVLQLDALLPPDLDLRPTTEDNELEGTVDQDEFGNYFFNINTELNCSQNNLVSLEKEVIEINVVACNYEDANKDIIELFMDALNVEEEQLLIVEGKTAAKKRIMIMDWTDSEARLLSYIVYKCNDFLKYRAEMLNKL